MLPCLYIVPESFPKRCLTPTFPGLATEQLTNVIANKMINRSDFIVLITMIINIFNPAKKSNYFQPPPRALYKLTCALYCCFLKVTNSIFACSVPRCVNNTSR